jgi:O-antigen/teichoic acid export membrane protein
MLLGGWGLVAIPAGLLIRWVVGSILYWVYIIIFTRSVLRIPMVICWSEVRHIAHLMTWTLVSNISRSLMSYFDRIAVGLMLGVGVTPCLVFTGKGWEVVQLFVGRVGIAFMPGLAHLHGEGSPEQFRKISLRLMQVVSSVLAIGCGAVLALNKTFTALWVGSGFYAGSLFNICMAVAVTLVVVSMTLQQILFAAGSIRQTAAANMVNALVRAALVVLMLRVIGITAAPVSTALAAMAVNLWYFLWQWMRKCGLVWSDLWGELCRVVVVYGVTVALAVVWMQLPCAHSWLLFIGYSAAYAMAAVVAVIGVDRNSRQFAVAATRWVLTRTHLLARH